MRQSTRILIFLSIFIAVSDGTFVYINYHSAKEALDHSLDRQGREFERAFQLSLQDIETTMALMATYVANEPLVQDLFSRGVQAVAAEGGGPGGPRADALRKELFEVVRPGWQEATAKYQVRQLHFHMGPGSTSFLRVHKSHRFGDNMDQCRYTVVDVNQQFKTVTGFETGRVVSGIRGVVPMFVKDSQSGEMRHRGALEAGTSFKTILPDLSRIMHSGLAVLLTEEHVQKNVWPEMMAKAFQDTNQVEGFYLEADAGPAKQQIVQAGVLAQLFENPGTLLVDIDGVPQSVTGFHLRDFQTTKNRELPPVGLVLIWADAIAEVAAFKTAVWTNIFFAMIGFCVVEILLFLAVRLITRHLESTINERTRQLHEAQDKLVDNARQVGMAQVAADVLHNVGNVLNSVVSGVSRLHKRVSTSKVDGVGKVADLLQDNENQLADFFAPNKKGSQIPQYLATLSEHLDGEQRQNLAGITTLEDHVNHIIRVIQDQQDKARGDAIIEEVDLKETFRKALEINEACIENFEIETRIDTHNCRPVRIDRHRVLQILVNLIRNAAQAMKDNGEAARTLTMEAEMLTEMELQIRVSDTGCGISPENMERIFNHGFTTKKTGHGFGLHGAANAATSLGGNLSVHSEGEGKGACFELMVPVSSRSLGHVI